MGSIRDHTRFSRLMLGELSMGELPHHLLDTEAELREWGKYHRKVSHTWERVDEIGRILGELGYVEALLHIALDYGVITEDEVRG